MIIGLIPARYQSSRLPGKPLLMFGDKTMIQRVYLQSIKSELIDKVYVVTDDERVKKSIDDICGNCLMIKDECLNGTERICIALNKYNDIFKDTKFIVNVQGDEPFINPNHIDIAINKMLKKNNSNWEIKTNKGTKFSTPNAIIAGGVGSFEPRKFNLKECEKYENNSVLYSVKDKSVFKGKTVSIFGGGDSAIDWALELSKDSKVNLIHRRDEFRGAQLNVNKVHDLNKSGKIKLFTKYQLKTVNGKDNLESIEIESDDKDIKKLDTDYILGQDLI